MHQLSPSLRSEAAELGARFASARPFRHLLIEDFFAHDFAEALHQAFPPFERGNALNEQGAPGGKSTVEQIRELGPEFAELDDLVRSRVFLDWLSQATGIPDLLYDPQYFGGGTHDNRHGQELDPHVDFNRHPETGWHRRLNLIVYLNPEWEDAWGGALELHSDPRSENDQVTLIAPRFNRCVVFETSEHSWHGFGRINLPEHRRQLSRRSVALYFYTEKRPAEETAPTHATIYVDRPLPERFAPGHTLDADDVQALKVLLARRDQHIQRLYRDLMERPAAPPRNANTLARALAKAAAGVTHYALSPRSPARRDELKDRLRPLALTLPGWIREPARAWWRAGAPAHAAVPTAPDQRPNRHLQLLRQLGQGAFSRGVPRAPSPLDQTPGQSERPDYARKLAEESSRFAKEVNVNDLPPIFHYWSNTYLRPALESFGVSNPDEFFAKAIRDAARSGRRIEVLSIGSGNCDTEVRVGALLREQGCLDWRITCLDLVPEMLERGRRDAVAQGLDAHFEFRSGDFNQWSGEGQRYDVIIANQCLHHVVELERLFANIRSLLADDGRFVTSDMIGRNGHQRWPEALQRVREFWRELPESYRYNLQLQRQEDEFMDWDCSVEGFEGIRSQDILPLLVQQFHFETFIAFGNLIDPFIDRSFGWHFDADSARDRAFIDQVHAADVEAIRRGAITPTHLMAVMTVQPPGRIRSWDNLDPARCIRHPEAGPSAALTALHTPAA